MKRAGRGCVFAPDYLQRCQFESKNRSANTGDARNTDLTVAVSDYLEHQFRVCPFSLIANDPSELLSVACHTKFASGTSSITFCFE